jgi:hypothetical protein
MPRKSGRLTYANVVSTIALIIALAGGTAYAAATIGSDDVIDNSLKSVDVRDGTLKAVDVADGSLGGADLKDASVGAADLAPGSVSGVVLRARSTGETIVTGTDEGTATSIPLTKNAWTQRARDLVWGAIEMVSYTKPVACSDLTFYIYVDSDLLTQVGSSFGGEGGQTVTRSFVQPSAFRFEPGAAQNHVLTLKASHGCPSGDVTVHSAKIDLVGFR